MSESLESVDWNGDIYEQYKHHEKDAVCAEYPRRHRNQKREKGICGE
jgi:hypothetical protein